MSDDTLVAIQRNSGRLASKRMNAVSALLALTAFIGVLTLVNINHSWRLRDFKSLTAVLSRPAFSSAIVRGANNTVRYGQRLANGIAIAVTCCGKNNDIVEQTLVMMKSAIVFTEQRIHFLVVTENTSFMLEKILEWPSNILEKITFEIREASFPKVKSPLYWQNAFKRCASQRLFYSIILPEYDSILHIDGDTIFLSPVDQLWSFFGEMKSSHILAMATEDMNPKTSWYKNSRHGPIPTEYSLNTGVISMNLTRMRSVRFFDALEPIVERYRDLIPWFVNDVLGVYLHRNPDRFITLPCHYNYLTDHCKSGYEFCESAKTDGVAILHGSRNTFFWPTEPTFRAVYRAFRDYQFNTDLRENLLIPLRENLAKTLDQNCSKNYSQYTVNVIKLINNFYNSKDGER